MLEMWKKYAFFIVSSWNRNITAAYKIKWWFSGLCSVGESVFYKICENADSHSWMLLDDLIKVEICSF